MRGFTGRILMVAGLALAVSSAMIGADQQQKQAEAMQFLNAVREHLDIRSPGSPPFRLVAKFKLAPIMPGQGPSEGTLTLIWQSPKIWREEIASPTYNAVRVASGEKLWLRRNIEFEPLRILEMHNLLNLPSRWKLYEGESAVDLQKKTRNGSALSCVSLKGEYKGRRELCADAQSLHPFEAKPKGAVDPKIEWPNCEDYAPWGNKDFPRQMQIFEGPQPVVQFQVQELVPSPDPDPALFSPPAAAKEWDWCDDMVPAVLVYHPNPKYPKDALAGRRVGVVDVYAVVEKNGSLSHLTPLRPGDPSLNDAAVAAVAQWQYRPARCGANPVPWETMIEVNFVLGE